MTCPINSRWWQTRTGKVAIAAVSAFLLSFTALFGPVHETGHAIAVVLLNGRILSIGWNWFVYDRFGDWRDNIVLLAGAGFELLSAAGTVVLAARKHKPYALAFGGGWYVGCWVYSLWLDEWKHLSYRIGVQYLLWSWYGVTLAVWTAYTALCWWYGLAAAGRTSLRSVTHDS